MRLSILALVSISTIAVAADPGYFRQPTIHRDTIVFVAEGDLWKVPITGGDATRLTTHPGDEGSPAISPDGQTIAFTGQYEGPTEVYTMPVAGGPPTRRTWDGGREKAPAAICRKVIHAIETAANEIEIWGDGQQTRSFMYIDDCVDGILRIMHSKIEEPINLGSDELTTINGLVEMVEDIASVELKHRHNLSAPKGVNGRNSDNTLIKKYLGWAPGITLRDGMERTYRWIREEYLKVHRGETVRT